MPEADSTLLFRELSKEIKFSSTEKRVLTHFAADLQKTVADGRPFTCLVTNNAALRALNRRFLHHDYDTDVLSFPSGDETGEIGEIAIAVEYARNQAAQLGHSLVAEVCILMLHGVLHLTGMDHEHDRGEMAQAEARWRNRFELPATLIERSKTVMAHR